MQPVRKRASSGSHRRIRLYTALGLILVLSAILISLYLRDRDSSKAPSMGALHEDPHVTLIGKTPEDLTAFEVFPPGHASFRLIRVGSGYQLADDPAFPLNTYMVDQMVQDLTTLDAQIVGDVADVTGGTDALGLGEEHFHVSAEYADGSSRTLHFGRASYSEIPSDYMMLSGDSTVYTVSPQIRSNLDFPLGALRPLPRINFNSDLLDALEVQDQDRYFELALDNGFWLVTSPLSYPADLWKIAEIKKDIETMRLAVYVGRAEALDLAAYGLSQPVRQVTFHLGESIILTQAEDGQSGNTQEVDAQSLRFSIGSEIGRVGFYCLYDGAVYQASYASMGFLTTLDLFGFLAAKPVIIPINRLLSLQVEDAANHRIYQVELVERIEKNNALALDEEGRQLYDPVISMNGAEFDQDIFVQEYLKLVDLAGQGRLPGDYTTTGAPVTRFGFTADGMRLDLAFYPFDALHLAMAVNGQAYWYVPQQAVADIAL